MKDFALDSKGDVVIFNNDTEMINGDELTRQKAEMVVGTNKGEWFLNILEGIDFKSILIKNPNPAIVQEEIEQALKMVDETFTITNFDLQQGKDRKGFVNFTATNERGERVSLTVGDGELN